MKTSLEKPAFWITNISPLNVTLADLALNIKARSSVNLLDEKHYKYTLEQIQKSATSGSIFKKRDKIVIRRLAPIIDKENIAINREAIIPSRERSIFSFKEEEYEELKVSDDEYAKENAELADVNVTKKV